MDPVWLLLLLPVAAASGWWMATRDNAEKSVPTGKDHAPVPESFYRGLNLLLNEQPDRALDAFLEATAVDNDTVEMHLALGNLFPAAVKSRERPRCIRIWLRVRTSILR